MSLPRAVLGIDVGGTTIKLRLETRSGELLDARRAPTPQGDAEALRLAELVAELAADAAQKGELDAIGLVVPGIVDAVTGRSVLAVNLGWRDVPVVELTRAALTRRGIHAPLAFGQDVRAGALAEATSGAARDVAGPVVFLPIGTGIAAAVVANGDVQFPDGWAGEVGQLRLTDARFGGRRLEEVASAAAVAAAAGTPDARTAVDRAAAGDPRASAALDDAVVALAEAAAWYVAVLGCSRIVLGGGLTEAGEVLLAPLRSAVSARTDGFPPVELVRAVHGDEAGAIGAAVLARRTATAGEAAR
ncbi:ROK family protein [Gryllotalpicola daejeonensis]|uniref:ROK family protein n=1 Tax=Gryllotalpicola daejeonensis TaxID=993087 RepID=A0ABP7ZNW2_9MICO